jgi:hypothetical protein
MENNDLEESAVSQHFATIPSSRCDLCSLIFGGTSEMSTEWEKKELKWHYDFHALELSAELGCDICRLLRQGIIYRSESYDYARKSNYQMGLSLFPDKVHLRVYGYFLIRKSLMLVNNEKAWCKLPFSNWLSIVL